MTPDHVRESPLHAREGMHRGDKRYLVQHLDF